MICNMLTFGVLIHFLFFSCAFYILCMKARTDKDRQTDSGSNTTVSSNAFKDAGHHQNGRSRNAEFIKFEFQDGHDQQGHGGGKFFGTHQDHLLQQTPAINPAQERREQALRNRQAALSAEWQPLTHEILEEDYDCKIVPVIGTGDYRHGQAKLWRPPFPVE